MSRYENDADCFYPDSFGWKSLTHTNVPEEMFSGITLQLEKVKVFHQYIS